MNHIELEVGFQKEDLEGVLGFSALALALLLRMRSEEGDYGLSEVDSGDTIALAVGAGEDGNGSEAQTVVD